MYSFSSSTLAASFVPGKDMVLDIKSFQHLCRGRSSREATSVRSSQRLDIYYIKSRNQWHTALDGALRLTFFWLNRSQRNLLL